MEQKKNNVKVSYLVANNFSNSFAFFFYLHCHRGLALRVQHLIHCSVVPSSNFSEVHQIFCRVCVSLQHNIILCFYTAFNFLSKNDSQSSGQCWGFFFNFTAFIRFLKRVFHKTLVVSVSFTTNLLRVKGQFANSFMGPESFPVERDNISLSMQSENCKISSYFKTNCDRAVLHKEKISGQ